MTHLELLSAIAGRQANPLFRRRKMGGIESREARQSRLDTCSDPDVGDRRGGNIISWRLLASVDSSRGSIDDDLGRSASGTVAQHGFDGLVAWLCAGKVGAVMLQCVAAYPQQS
jgi:hypothetical protein